MRDLVIWMVALRVARGDGGAILVSGDKVHSDERGGEEAKAAGLSRARDLDEALELLGRVSPPGALARQLLAAVWAPLRTAGLPLPVELTLRKVTDISFALDAAGHATGIFTFATNAEGGMLTASASIEQTPGHIRVELSRVMIGANVWNGGVLSLSVPGELPVVGSPDAERLGALRKTIGVRE